MTFAFDYSQLDRDMKKKLNLSISSGELARQKRIAKLVADVKSGSLQVHSGESALK